MRLETMSQGLRGESVGCEAPEAILNPTRGGDDWITVERRFRVKRRTTRAPGRVTRSGARASS
jgi:hypothetical protein